MSKPDFLFYENEATGLGFIWEGGGNIDVLSRAFREGGENRKMPGWFVTFDTIGGLWDFDKDAPARPYLQDELEAEALEWLVENGHIEADEEELDPLAQWAEDTGNEVGSGETLLAIELIAGLNENDKALALAVGVDLWARGDVLPGALAGLDEVRALSLVVGAMSNNVLVTPGAVDADELLLKQPIAGAWELETEAASHALGLVHGWNMIVHNPNGDVPTLAMVHTDLPKVRMYCQVSPPGYDWFQAPGIGFVVYRTGNLS